MLICQQEIRIIMSELLAQRFLRKKVITKTTGCNIFNSKTTIL